MSNKLIIKPKDSDDIGEIEKEIEETEQQAQEPREKPLQVSIHMRRGLDGRLIIYEHDHVDIVFIPDNMKIISFAKKDYSDIIYETQNRLFEFLVKKGICSPESVQGGNVYGSIEGKIMKPKDGSDTIEHLLVLNLRKWLDNEKPALEMDKKYSERFTDMLTDPDKEDSTELGEVPQEEEKGSIPRYATRRYIGGWW